MDEWSVNNQDRAKVVWEKLLGFFGDGLLKKFDAEPNDEWIDAIGELSEFQIRRGLRRLKYSWKFGVPSLPDFVHYCTAIGDNAPDEGPVERAPVTAIRGPQFDGWDVSGNMKFWKYVSHRLMDSCHPWGPPASTELAQATRIAVSYKNAWAQDMREACSVDTATGEIVLPAKDEQARQFAQCMKRAEADIVALAQEKAA